MYTKQEIDQLLKDLKKPTVYVKGTQKSILHSWKGKDYQFSYIFKNLVFEKILGIQDKFGTNEFIFTAPYEAPFHFEIQIAVSLSDGENPPDNFQSEKYQLAANFTEISSNESILKNFMLCPFKNYTSEQKNSGIFLGGTNTCIYLLKGQSIKTMVSCRAIAAFPENTIIMPKHTYIIVSS